ncbi:MULTISPECIES: MFS transporter [Pseudoalteromonas]|jgi:1-acyl-sn-glycerol-3-phosphate acyltransferase|uniref:MFS transporter n=1 Tax=Pseudoalteromonas TaxID=53246 RepID=UPI0002C9696A|nr:MULTISPECIES: MFS transporter [Pseudoalteromonas]MCP4056739.1 MFS transporter [Pseudoalteromonas sp.]ENN98443.1 phospholipid/glycerol acyltransferase [Pseudoalteromonas agarivorans S816]MDI3245686.1 MFS transporter [Pseudoalteromonas agarivorans]TMS64563.1 MFS transporter [Pseudoalteromonas sp. S1691]TMS67065.1 MFS transporter [Pseudoalteromonas sp. S1731]
MQNNKHDNKGGLLSSKRFLPLFLTQFLSAMNDNVYKQSVLILLVFQAATLGDGALYSNLAAGLFILPFFLFSGMAGQLAEKTEKSKLIRLVKFCEIPVMVIGAASIFTQYVWLMLTTVFFMGLQSTFFGPLKYSILPQHVAPNELTKANGLVESATFVAILIGTIFGTYYITQTTGPTIISIAVLILAVLGFFSSRFIPISQANNPNLHFTYNIFSSTKNVFKALNAQTESVGKSVLGISWFWLIGAVILTALPNYVKHVMGGDELVVTSALVVFSLSIAVGSLLCEKLSRSRIELGIVPFGAILITLFLYLLSQEPAISEYIAPSENLLTLKQVLNTGDMVWHFVWMAGIGIASGFYTVPLYALIQQRTEEASRSRVIAANNVLNALFMVGSAILSIVTLFVLEWHISSLLLLLAGLNLLISIYIYTKVPEFFLRFVIYILAICMYRVRTKRHENIPSEGAAVIVANHVSFVDWMFILATSPRPIRFMVFAPIYYSKALHWLFKMAKAIPIDSEKANPKAFAKAFDEVAAALERGELVGIFPEGKLTSNGEMDMFRRGIERIIARTPVPVVPVHLDGLWGSMFSRKAKWQLPRLKWSLVSVSVGEPIEAEQVSANYLHEQVSALKAQHAKNTP